MSGELAQLDVLGIAAPKIRGRLAELQERLLPLVHSLQLICPKSVDALRLAVAQSADRQQALCVAGGDGTINQVVNAMDLDRQKLIVLPVGRGNDFVRALGLPLALDRAVQRLPQLTFRRVDVGLVGDIRFVNSAGIGLDAAVLEVMARQHGLLRRNYLLAFVFSITRLRPLGVKCGLFPRASGGRCWWLLAMNGRWIGGGIPIAPVAGIQDGKLDVIAVTAGSRWTLMRKLAQVLARRHLVQREVEFLQRGSFDVEGLSPPLLLAVDGELYPWHESRLSFRTLPGALTVLC